ncbi:hypothetical protein QE152_g4359 [Popillia japonica]|uniref:Uncharacterized protein n=1 Tax=Popillia japonica TaxID=7064 RepID=A0AAW1N112_POPJA
MPKWPRGKLQDHYEDSAVLHMEKANQMKKAVLQIISGQKTLREAATHLISKSALQRYVSKYKGLSDDEKAKYIRVSQMMKKLNMIFHKNMDQDFMMSYVTDRPFEVATLPNPEPQNTVTSEANTAPESSIEVHNVGFDVTLEKISVDSNDITTAYFQPPDEPAVAGPSHSKASMLVTPEAIRPHPKAAPRKNTTKRKKDQSLILADTPIKESETEDFIDKNALCDDEANDMELEVQIGDFVIVKYLIKLFVIMLDMLKTSLTANVVSFLRKCYSLPKPTTNVISHSTGAERVDHTRKPDEFKEPRRYKKKRHNNTMASTSTTLSNRYDVLTDSDSDVNMDVSIDIDDQDADACDTDNNKTRTATG